MKDWTAAEGMASSKVLARMLDEVSDCGGAGDGLDCQVTSIVPGRRQRGSASMAMHNMGLLRGEHCGQTVSDCVKW